jgi:hypothetical protein
VKQPQSSCPFQHARQEIYGLGYSLLVTWRKWPLRPAALILLEELHGRGEFLGGDTQDEGLHAYRAIEARYEATHSGRYQPGPGAHPVRGSGQAGQAHEEVALAGACRKF